jgi:hypothetical protein
MSLTTITSPIDISRARISAHWSLFRLDHCVKQIFVLPGIVIAASLTGAGAGVAILIRIALGLSAVVAVASSNYVLNEFLDAPFDRQHPTKCLRPAASASSTFRSPMRSGWFRRPAWISAGPGVEELLSSSVLSLWVMGCFYNIPPVRMKDIPYLDVLSESINNPIRFAWDGTSSPQTVIPPVSLLLLTGCWALTSWPSSGSASIARSAANRRSSTAALSVLQRAVLCSPQSLLRGHFDALLRSFHHALSHGNGLRLSLSSRCSWPSISNSRL